MSTATAAETARVLGGVLLPALAEGVIRRRPAVTAYAARHDLDGRAVRVLSALRDRRGDELLRLRVPGRDLYVVLRPADVADLLGRIGDFTPATVEKRAALAHFQPHGVLISTGDVRVQRRALNEHVLDTGHPMHRHATFFTDLIRHELAPLDTVLDTGRAIGWRPFAYGWWRIVRQIVLGRAARDDHALTGDLDALRDNANWAYLRAERRASRDRFHRRIARYLVEPDPHSLAGQLRLVGADSPADTDPAGQIPHWLFAFDAAGASTMRAAALVSAYPDGWARVRDDLDFARACVLDTVRLYPTTLVILRDAVRATDLGGVRLPQGASLIVHSGFFHRDRRTLPYADEFRPDIWLDGTAAKQPGLVPFSAGPAACPGEDLVTLTAATALRALAGDGEGLLATGSAGPVPAFGQTVPAGLDHFSLRLSRFS